jgi:Fe-S cluster assembly protein SufD
MVNFININKELSGDKTRHITFDKPEEYVVFLHNISGRFVFDLQSKCRVYIFGLFIGKDTDDFKIETIQHHQAVGSFSDLLIKGVFRDKSKFHYQGLIKIEQTGQQSHAYQKNQNLVLSKDVFVESRPFLEILANDVFCTHGSTTGKLNKEDIFYLQTRGLNKSNSEGLLVEGFVQQLVDAVAEKVPNFNQKINLL